LIYSSHHSKFPGWCFFHSPLPVSSSRQPSALTRITVFLHLLLCSDLDHSLPASAALLWPGSQSSCICWCHVTFLIETHRCLFLTSRSSDLAPSPNPLSKLVFFQTLNGTRAISLSRFCSAVSSPWNVLSPFLYFLA
jgi:hypothetical protein